MLKLLLICTIPLRKSMRKWEEEWREYLAHDQRPRYLYFGNKQGIYVIF